MDTENNALLSMSDEEFMNTPWDSTEEVTEETQEEATVEETTVTEEVTEEVVESSDESDESEEEQEEEPLEEDAQEDPEEVNKEEESDSEEEEVNTSEDDSKSQLTKLFAPFTANGKEMKVDSVDDAIRLMQMGANYTKKMTALKPGLKVLKMLENNGLMDEGKLSYLIDLDKKNPDAIKQLVKDSNIDSFDLDQNNDSEYKPNTYTVDDKELALDAVLEAIQDTPTYADTVNIVSTKWDSESRKAVVANPEIIRVINEHKSNGIYDQIAQEIDREKMLGRLSGISDIEAYRQVGDKLAAQGRFDPEPAQQSSTVAPKPQATKKADPKLAKRKRAASITKSAPASTTPPDFNPLNLSDEEFQKQFPG